MCMETVIYHPSYEVQISKEKKRKIHVHLKIQNILMKKMPKSYITCFYSC
jgi:hypothetical protein